MNENLSTSLNDLNNTLKQKKVMNVPVSSKIDYEQNSYRNLAAFHNIVNKQKLTADKYKVLDKNYDNN